ncbi:HAD family hydrolase [Candidatus Bipolaricaulota bacterium]|nr:HAD family hydrolase [Candidatus Bipolaricaulota bacterium]
MIRALILDFDGLILDTETPLLRSWHEIYRQAGMTVSKKTWAGLLGAVADPPEAYALLEGHLGHPVDRNALRERRFARELEFLQDEPAMEGVCALLEEASGRGLLLGVASSSQRAWVEGHLKQLGLHRWFQTIATADDVERTKPAPDLYIRAMRELGVKPESAIAFEDSLHGVRAAKSAGLFVVAVPNDVTRHLPMPEADLIVASIAEKTLDEYIACAEAWFGDAEHAGG